MHCTVHALALLCLVGASGCCPNEALGPRLAFPSPAAFAGLRGTVAELLALADRQAGNHPTTTGAGALERALAALHLCSAQGGSAQEIHWRLARALFQLTEHPAFAADVSRLALLGAAHAQHAETLSPRRVEPPYYLALNMAKLAEAEGRLALIKPMLAAAERARSIDERFDRAGVLVFLGKVYLSAPAWPVSVGNPERAVALLERALRLDPRPLTRVFLAQAYQANEQPGPALEQLQRALREGPTDEAIPPRFRREARSLLSRLRAP